MSHELGLAECIIYLMDKSKKLLIPKAAYGNRNKGKREILDPITIPYGKDIVGYAAVSGEPEIIADGTLYDRSNISIVKLPAGSP